MNIFTIIFLQNFSKLFSKTHQIAPFLKIFSEEHAPEPPSKRVALSLLRKYFEPAPPPPPPK